MVDRKMYPLRTSVLFLNLFILSAILTILFILLMKIYFEVLQLITIPEEANLSFLIGIGWCHKLM